MKNHLWKVGLLIFLIATAYIATIEDLEKNSDCTYYMHTTETLNMSDGAGAEFNIVGKVPHKYHICIDTIDNGWAHIKDSHWVNLKYIEKDGNDFYDKYIDPIIVGPIFVFTVILFIIKFLGFLFNIFRESSGVKCTWCGKKNQMKFIEGDEKEWTWEHRNKDGSPDNRFKDNQKVGSYTSIWECEKCGAKSQFEHNYDKKPSKNIKVLSGKLIEDGSGNRISDDFYN